VTPDFAPRRRPWLTHGFAALAVFLVTAFAIEHAVERQTAILDAMELQPISAAATLAYAWGSADDAKKLLAALLAMAERGAGASAPHSSKDPDFALLRRMDGDLARFRLALLERAPPEKLADLCAHATIRCTPRTLDGLVAMLKKQRHVP
jgi:hypothetical protein